MKNQIKTILLLGVLSSALVGIGAMFGRPTLVLFTILAFAINLGSYFFSHKIVLAMNRAREVSPADAPRLHAIVDELASRANMPKPRVYIIDDPHANAFATGRNPKNGVVAVTTGILQLLDERELRGVLAHELAHISNRDILVSTIAAGIATAISYFANWLQFAAIFGGASSDDEDGGTNPIAALAFAFIAPILAMLVQFGISRSREFLADESGAKLSGDPEALARALQKLHRRAESVPGDVAPATASLYIVNPLSGARLANLLSTHPAPEERVRRLLAMAGIRAA